MILFSSTGLGEPTAHAMTAALREALPGDEVVRDVAPADRDKVRYAVVWRPPSGLLSTLPNLAVVFNTGAGVDALIADPTLPDVPVVRFVDEDLTGRMVEWVVLQVLLHHRRALGYLRQQREARWREIPAPPARDVGVGILGFGTLGMNAAVALRDLGYAVHAYSRREGLIEAPVKIHRDLTAFLAATDILVALLPLTDKTRAILDARLFAGLRQSAHGPVLVNAGRGGLQVEADIVAALEAGTLKGASLDVFEEEPLPAHSPLWAMETVVVTPHVAAISAPDALARSVGTGIAAHRAGRPLANLVDRARGY